MKHLKFLFIVLIIFSFPKINVAQKPIQLKSDEIFGAIRARQIGPAVMSGRVTDREGHPSDSKILYVAAAGGGVWKSNNSGVTFNSIF